MRLTRDGVVKKRRKLKTGKRAVKHRRPQIHRITIGEGADLAGFISEQQFDEDNY